MSAAYGIHRVMGKVRVLPLCVVPFLMAASPHWVNDRLVCAFNRTVECTPELVCEPPPGDAFITPPTFVHLDLDRREVTLLAPESRRGEVTAIEGMERLEDRVLLSGIEGDRSWSAVILEDGTMSVSVAVGGGGFVVFGQCILEEETRPGGNGPALDSLESSRSGMRQSLSG